MTIKTETFISNLATMLQEFNLRGASEACNELVSSLEEGQTISVADAVKILQLLRNKRMFAQMQKVADVLLYTGHIHLGIQRQLAQALIDSGNYSSALYVIESVISSTSNPSPFDIIAFSENAEAHGLMGRLFKQLYVNLSDSKSPICRQYITLAVRSYYEVYARDQTKTWHGINAVALIQRAERDNVRLPIKVNSRDLAVSILAWISDLHARGNSTAWDFATAAEACVALNEPEQALHWLSGYSRMPYCDAFELGSTLRQLEELWQLDLSSKMGQYVLPILRSELLARKGGNVVLSPVELKEQKENANEVDKIYRSQVKQGFTLNETLKVKLEKVFGDDSYKTYKWYMEGASRCEAVARIGADSTKGFGTGFILPGNGLCTDLGDELVLVTNAHVVSPAYEAEESLRPEEAIAIFEALDPKQEFSDLQVAWSSPSRELDATVLRFNRNDIERLMALTKTVKRYPVSKYLPAIDEPPSQKIYVIGHPHGGTLQLSFQDNLLIDHDQTTKIHYRTPTDGGSSGSPVFNQQWQLIGLHHAGSEEMPCLNGKAGTYAANEGIWIQKIIAEAKSHCSEAGFQIKAH